jgi:hypothetical protein
MVDLNTVLKKNQSPGSQVGESVCGFFDSGDKPREIDITIVVGVSHEQCPSHGAKCIIGLTGQGVDCVVNGVHRNREPHVCEGFDYFGWGV